MFKGKKVVALVQARCTSTRLPKKHFRYIGDKMLIDWVVDRLKKIEVVDEIIISTTSDETDLPFKDYAEKKGVVFFGFDGDINDVVGRHYQAAKKSNADYILVISGDCPLVDENLVNQELNLIAQGNDYLKPSTECIHEGVDACTLGSIESLERNSKTVYERENFGIWFKENPSLVKIGLIDVEPKYRGKSFRISVDNLADLRFMNELFNKLKFENKPFDLEYVIDLVNGNKELLEINSHIQQKKKNEKTYNFLIKTEASKESGLGHIKRMMALGQYFNENRNNGVLYAINKDETAKKILDEKGYIYDYIFVEKEEELIQCINKYKTDILIIDVQRLEGNTKYNFENIKKKTKVKKIVLIDKFFKSDFVDLMIFQGVQSDAFEEKVKNDKCVLYGLNTVFIDNALKKIKRDESTVENEIVISFGGSDINNLTTKILNLINNMNINKDYTYKIIIGPYFNHMNELIIELAKFKYKFKIIINPSNIGEEIKNCKLGIIYYGVSFYEFKYLKIPTIDILTDELYQEEFKKVSALGIGNFCGIKDKLDLKKIERTINNIPMMDKTKLKISDFEFLYERIVEVL